MRSHDLLGLRGIAVAAAILGMTALYPTQAIASLIFTENTVFNGSTPTSTPPWLTATFTTVSPGTVTLKLSASLNVASEFIDSVVLNVDPNITPSDLAIGLVSCTGCIFDSSSTGADNAEDLTGGGNAGKGFDVLLTFDNAPPANRFNGIDVATFTITDMTDLITESSFNFTNTGSAAAHLGIHVQGIPIPGSALTTSGAIMDGPVPVPEPSSILLLGLGILGLGAIRRRRRG